MNQRLNRLLYKIFFSLIISPVFLASILGVLWNIKNLPVLKPLLTMATMLGAIAAPCALFCIGMILTAQLSSPEGFVTGWFIEHFLVHIIKLVIQPVITLWLSYLVRFES